MRVRKLDIDVREVDEDLFRFVIPQPLYEPNYVYFVRDEHPMIIDSGYIESIGYLAQSLRYLGYSLNSIEYALFTHNHVDHISGGLLFSVYAKHIKKLGHYGLLKQSDFLIYFHNWIHENERLVDFAFNDESIRTTEKNNIRKRWYNFLKQFDAPKGKKGDRYIELYRGLRESDTLSTGKYNWEITETPGHNTWHITPIEKNKKWIFTGDLIIGNIPAIYSHSEGSLCDYIESMNKLMEFKDYQFFPSHGKEIDNPEKRIKILLKTLSILERNILKRLQKSRSDAFELTKDILGQSSEQKDSLMLAIALTESILRKLLKEKKIDSTMYYNGYEVFHTG